MTTWLLAILAAILSAAVAVFGTWYTMKVNAAKERSDRDSERARELRDILMEKRDAILQAEAAPIRGPLRPIEAEAAFLHSAELRHRLKSNFEGAANSSLMEGVNRLEVVETYLGDAIADLEAAVRGDRLPAPSHRAAWFDMIRENQLPSHQSYREMASELMRQDIDPDFEELAYEDFCEERERRMRRRLPSRKSSAPRR
ncbi:hypothetical protein VT50_0234750 [Streptomyces antioxidans]|uniref:Uncharacterized protein n=1 Tax=Streptomyces antioxidans TaxID=1507734 RepID=A0A1V4CUQ4_9ACTN|nr:hypothetical protein [Streptomyces antioxidans]OPF71182.1 hypothetical protein VT50_0234750 [Streptomyces antioxidans]